MREGLGEWICTKAMARGNCWKWQRIIPKAIVQFSKRFSIGIFPSEKHLVLSPNKKGKPPRPKTKSWVNSNETLVIKKIFWEGEFFRRKFSITSLKSNKSLKKPNKILGVTTPTPLGKISSPRFQLILKQVWVLCPKKILALPSCFVLGVIARLNSEKLNGFLSGPPFRLL